MAVKEIPESQWHPWMRAAMALGRQTKGWHLVARGSPEDTEWMAYFEKLGWTPMIVRKALEAYTMPTRWPSWLPHDWEPMKQIEPATAIAMAAE